MTQRLLQFRDGFTAAVRASAPLADINAGLLETFHKKTLSNIGKYLISAIPFEVGSEAYKVAKTVLLASNVWQDPQSEKLFRPSRAENIDIFATTATPYQPVVYDSLMSPIAKAWRKNNSSAAKRASFMQWRRARPLDEALPMMPSRLDSMLRGYFAAQLLSYIKNEDGPAETGPKISIWRSQAEGYSAFPHPLFFPGIAQVQDIIGILMESVNVALLECSAQQSIDPLLPYHRLLDLGSESRASDISTPLKSWILKGETPAGAPAIDPKRAGTSTMQVSERKEIMQAFLVDRRAKLVKYLADDPLRNYHDNPVGWEIRDTILLALSDLTTMIQTTDDASDET
jgi:hypothetical protein